MTQALDSYVSASEAIEMAEKGQMFGKPCYKISGKAFVCFFQDEMVFKLSGDSHKNALALDGAQLFDPSGKGRAMKAWVQVPFVFEDQWAQLAVCAQDFILSEIG